MSKLSVALIIASWCFSGLFAFYLMGRSDIKNRREWKVGDLPDLDSLLMFMLGGGIWLLVAIADALEKWRDRHKDKVLYRRHPTEDEILKEAEEILRRRID